MTAAASAQDHGMRAVSHNQKNPEKHSYKYLMTLKIIAAADLTTQLEVLLQTHRGKA